MENRFLTNYTDISFLEKLKDNLKKCKTFSFSVSFIKKAGLILFERELEEALEQGVQGRIITSTYQNFTDISSFPTTSAINLRQENVPTIVLQPMTQEIKRKPSYLFCLSISSMGFVFSSLPIFYSYPHKILLSLIF